MIDTETAIQEAEEKASRKSEVSGRRAEARGKKNEISRTIEKLKAERDRHREEAEADALIRDRGTAVAERTDTQIETLQGRIDEMRTRIETLNRNYEEAQAELEEAATRAVRALREDLETALEDLEAALEDLAVGEGPVLAHDRAVREARARVRELDQQLNHWASQSRATPKQKGRLRRHLREFGRGLSGAALVGWAIAESLGWLRRFNEGPVADCLDEYGVEPVNGSPRHAQPFGALEQVASALGEGRLPDEITRV